MVLKRVVTAAPGKIILSGEHAVVYGTEAIACAIDMRTTCKTCVLDNSTKLQVSFGDLVKREWSVAAVNEAMDESGMICNTRLGLLVGDGDRLQKLAVEVVLRLYLLVVSRHFKAGDAGLSIELTTQLPIGSGLGSSASLSVAMASCFLVLCEDLAADEQLWTESEVEQVNKFAYVGEMVVHGAPSGIDNRTITSGHFLSLKAGHFRCLHELKNAKLDILIVDTKQPRSTKQLVSMVKGYKEKFPEVKMDTTFL